MVNDTVIRNFFYTSTPEHEGVLFHIPSGRFFRVFDEKCKSDFRQIFEIGSLSEDVLEMLHKIDSGKGVCSGSCENCDNQIKSANEFTVREYYGAAEPPVRCGESHLSGLTEPPHFVY